MLLPLADGDGDAIVSGLKVRMGARHQDHGLRVAEGARTSEAERALLPSSLVLVPCSKEKQRLREVRSRDPATLRPL